MRNRKLHLRRETVTELGHDDLGRIHGASAGTCRTCVHDCVIPAITTAIAMPRTSDCFTHHSAADCLSDQLCN